MYLRSEIHLKIHCVKTMELGISAIAVEQIEVKPMKMRGTPIIYGTGLERDTTLVTW